MALIVLVIGFAIAALSIWLAVRLFNRRERWAKWTAVGAGLLIAYPLSIGPMYRVFVESIKPNAAPAWFDVFYAPVYYVAFSAPETLGLSLFSYLMLWGAQP